MKFSRVLPALACAWTCAASAQSLDEQYDFYLGTLSRRCQNLNFDVDAGIVARDLDTRRIVGIRRVPVGSPSAPPLIGFFPPLTPVDSATHSREENAAGARGTFIQALLLS